MEKYVVIQVIGNTAPSKHVIREFEDKQYAETYVDMLRKSEKLEFVKYFIAQVTDY